MIDPLKTVASAPSSNADRRGDNNAPFSQKEAAPPQPQKQKPTLDEPLRLVVEPTDGGQGFTYKLFDRTTGELLIELPRETATEMSNSPDYSAGKVFTAKA